MPEHSTPKERVDFGLESIPPDRTVSVPLRDLIYVYQTLAELIQFFHQPDHYPDLRSIEQFIGTRGSGGALDILFESHYRRMHGMMPGDILEAFAMGDRFEHPQAPRYFEKGEDTE